MLRVDGEMEYKQKWALAIFTRTPPSAMPRKLSRGALCSPVATLGYDNKGVAKE